MDEIQYTYKLCKLVLMASNYETNRCILWSSKPKHVFFKIKTISHEIFWHILCVCIYKLEQSTTNLFFTFYLKTQNLNTYRYDSSLENLLLKIFFFILTWFKPRSKELDSWVLDAIFETRALESTRDTSKLDFESFVEAKHRLRSWYNIWNLLNTTSLVL